MSRMKDWLTDQIEKLSAVSSYSFEFLMEQFWAYQEECAEDDVEFDWAFFRAVTLERDW